MNHVPEFGGTGTSVPAMRARLVGSTGIYPSAVAPSFSLERALEGIRSVGLEKVEVFGIRGYCEHVNLDDVSVAAATRLRRLFEHHRMVPSVLNFAAQLDTDEGVECFRRAAQFAERLDVRLLVANTASAADPIAKRAFFDRVPSIVSAAQQHDVVLALEIHGGLVSTLSDGAALVERVGSERIRIAYDIANVVKFGGLLPEADLRENAASIKNAIAYVHLKDRTSLSDPYFSPPFGDGVLDFTAVLHLLDTAGYDGLLALEVRLDGRPESPEVVDAALRKSLAHLERIWRAEGGSPDKRMASGSC